MRHFKAGCLSQHISAWEEITSNQKVLQTVQGMKLEFEENPLHGECSGFEIPKNQPLIQKDVNKLLKKVLLWSVNTNLQSMFHPFS